MCYADILQEKYGPAMRPSAVAEFLNCHPSHVRAMCKKGDLPAVRIGDRWFVPTAKLAALFDGGGDGNE